MKTQIVVWPFHDIVVLNESLYQTGTDYLFRLFINI